MFTKIFKIKSASGQLKALHGVAVKDGKDKRYLNTNEPSPHNNNLSEVYINEPSQLAFVFK